MLQYAMDDGAPGVDDSYGSGLLQYAPASKWNDATYTDVAASGIFLDAAGKSDDGTLPLVVSAQNMGNTTIAEMVLACKVGDEITADTFKDVALGDVLSMTIPVEVAENGEITIVTQVICPDKPDDREANDVKIRRFEGLAAL